MSAPGSLHSIPHHSCPPGDCTCWREHCCSEKAKHLLADKLLYCNSWPGVLLQRMAPVVKTSQTTLQRQGWSCLHLQRAAVCTSSAPLMSPRAAPSVSPPTLGGEKSPQGIMHICKSLWHAEVRVTASLGTHQYRQSPLQPKNASSMPCCCF